MPSLTDVEKLCVLPPPNSASRRIAGSPNPEGELIDFIHEAHANKASGLSSMRRLFAYLDRAA